MVSDFFNRFESGLRRLLGRAGGAIDDALHSRLGGEDGPRIDISALIARLETDIENGVVREGERFVAPNLIDLKLDYETWTRLDSENRDYLERELTENIHEYIDNRRYELRHPLRVRIGYDPFTRGVTTILATGPDPDRTNLEQVGSKASAISDSTVRPDRTTPAPITSHIARSVITLIAEGARGGGRINLSLASDGEPVGIGRNIANGVVVNDPTVSNFHAALILRPNGALELADRGSANGTAVNGIPLPGGGRAGVSDGDRIRFGSIEFLVLCE